MGRPQALLLSVLGLAALVIAAHAVELPSGPSRHTRTRITVRRAPASGSSTIAIPSPRRVPARPAVTARHTTQAVPDRRAIADDVPAGTPLLGEYIVIYKADVNVEAAVAQSQAQAQAMTAAAVASGGLVVAAGGSDAMVSVLSTHQAPEGVPSQAVIEVPSELDPEQVRATLMASDAVEAVVQNRVVRITQDGAGATCYPPSLAAGVQASAPAGKQFKWDGCLTGTNKLGVFGDRCGSSSEKFRWLGVYAYNPSTGQAVPGCVYLRSSETDATRQQQFFGSCGVAPTNFVGLPTSVCLEKADSICADASNVANYAVKLSTTLCSSPSSNQAVFQGVACGPNNALIAWNTLLPQGCQTLARSQLDTKQASEWLGQCGVPPFQISGLPTRICGRLPSGGSGGTTPPPTTPSPTPPTDPTPPPPTPPSGVTPVPWVLLKNGESTQSWGMARIGALDSQRRVKDPDALVASGRFRAVVIDTGSDRTHPDLNVIDFVDLVDSPGSQYYGQDGNGHGTHVAGIIGARNQGSGMAGVVPGMPIVAIKVMGASGSGPLDTVYRGYAEVLARLQKGEKITSVNLSLGAPIGDQASQDVECGWVTKIASYGTAVVCAAGNDNGKFLGSNMPSACPNSIAVTSITSSDSPSSFSNLAYTSSPAALKARTLSAPGSQIWSTYPDGQYATLSGTSMATPHVTGAFAMCVLAGACKLSSSPNNLATTSNYPVVVAAASAQGCSGSRCWPSYGTSYYYGPCVNVRQW